MRILLACVLVVLAPSTVRAAEVKSDSRSLTLTAAPGETNRVTVSHDGAQAPFTVKVFDTGAALTADAGCMNTDPHTAHCVPRRASPAPNCVSAGMVEEICVFRAELGDKDDDLTITGLDRWRNQVDMGAGDDELEGDDRLEEEFALSSLVAFGGPGDDRLLGGAGIDLLSGGPGADFIQGRGGFDQVTYAEAGRAAGVRVRIDDAPGDGALGEGDDIRAEGIEGTPAADVLIGNDVANYIIGNGGDDRIVCRGGADQVITANLTDAANDCEFVSDGQSDFVAPAISGPLRVRNGAVDVEVKHGPAGRLRIATLGGRRLGVAQVPKSSEVATIRVRLRHELRRSIPVRVTGIVPGKSFSRVVATLRP